MLKNTLRSFKIKLGLGLFFLTTPVFASIINGWNTNLLAGFGMGYIDLTGSAKTVATYNQGVPPGFQNLIIRDYSDHKIYPSLIGGYQGTYYKWLVGAEINLDWQNLSRTLDFAFSDSAGITGWDGSINYDRKFIFGLTGRVGYSFVSFMMPYLRFGLEASDDELNASYSDINGVVAFAQGAHVESWVYRFLFGVGVEMPLPTCLPLSLRMEYDYHSKGKTLNAATAGVGGVYPIMEGQMQPKAQSGCVSLIWNFF
jgi:hypothetical protein